MKKKNEKTKPQQKQNEMLVINEKKKTIDELYKEKEKGLRVNHISKRNHTDCNLKEQK